MIHGQTKSSKVISEEEKQKKEELAAKILAMSDQFLKIRSGKVQSANPLEITTLLAQMCPDLYTIYNYRRELLKDSLEKIEEAKEKHKLISGEVDLVTGLLRKQPKSYCLWHHRKWMILKGLEYEKMFEISEKEKLVNKELFLCSKMLEKDERNFHVWNYRNWVVTLDPSAKEITENELKFTKEKIKQNFTNFSALHFRGKSLVLRHKQILSETKDSHMALEIALFSMPLKLVKDEFDFIRTGIFMQSDEQGIWQYHKWLLNQILPFQVNDVRRCRESETKETERFLLSFNRKIGNIGASNIKLLTSEGKPVKYSISNLDNIRCGHFWLLEIEKAELLNHFGKDGENPIEENKLIFKLAGPGTLLANAAPDHENYSFLTTDSITDLNGGRNFEDISIEIYFKVSGDKTNCRVRVEGSNSTGKKTSQPLINEILAEEKNMINEILELEPYNKYALLEKNFLNEYEIELTQSDDSQKGFILKMLNENISNLQLLIEKYPKQLPVFQAALKRSQYKKLLFEFQDEEILSEHTASQLRAMDLNAVEFGDNLYLIYKSKSISSLLLSEGKTHSLSNILKVVY